MFSAKRRVSIKGRIMRNNVFISNSEQSNSVHLVKFLLEEEAVG